MALKHKRKLKQPSTGSTAAQARLGRDLARVVADGDQLWAELQETSEEYQARVARGAPVQRTLARYNRLGARHDVVEQRRRELVAKLPPRQPATNDDF